MATKTIKNITSCTHCGDTYSVDDALKNAYGFSCDIKTGKGLTDSQNEQRTSFFLDEQLCLNCRKKYTPLHNFRPVTMDKWIYDMHKGCKGG